jgi:RNA methyltransferase, TrmH family
VLVCARSTYRRRSSSARDAELVALAERRGATVVELGPAAFRSISGQVRPDGVLAVVERWATSLAALDLCMRPLLLVAVGIERPGNLGTIIRTACSAGATALLACDQTSDVFNPEAVRGSVGTLFHLPIAQCPSEDAISWLGEQGVAVVVATPHAARPHWTGDYAEAVALVVGSERHGVPNAWLAAADAVVTIPMPGSADSLNVAVAAGVVLFEAVRQRLGAAGTDPLRGSVPGPATPWRATSPSRAAPRSA